MFASAFPRFAESAYERAKVSSDQGKTWHDELYYLISIRSFITPDRRHMNLLLSV